MTDQEPLTTEQEAQEKSQQEAQARYAARLAELMAWPPEQREAHLCVLIENANALLGVLVNQTGFICQLLNQREQAGRIVRPH